MRALLGLSIMLHCTSSPAGELRDRFALELVGGRFAFPARDGSRGFRAADAFLGCSLPLSWRWTEHLALRTRLDFQAGWLGRDRNDAATAGVGPVLVLEREDWPVSFEGGSGSTLISRHDFGDVHLGTPYQFTTHIGINWRFATHFRLTYRFEHLSNAGIARPNPGVNLHAFALACLF